MLTDMACIMATGIMVSYAVYVMAAGIGQHAVIGGSGGTAPIGTLGAFRPLVDRGHGPPIR